MKKFLCCFVLIFSMSFPVSAEEPAFRERIIGSAFKGLASAYLANCDFKKEKRRYIERLEETSDEDFVIRYGSYWPLIEKLPVRIKVENGFSQTMTREQLISRLQEVRREDLQAIINGVPDSTVSREFDRRIKRLGKKVKENDLAQQVQILWQRILKKAGQFSGKTSKKTNPVSPVGQNNDTISAAEGRPVFN